MSRKNGMSNFEMKFGKYAIPNLSLILVMCYIAGYVIGWINPEFMDYLTLNPYEILHGQIWRIFTWVIKPPESFGVFTIVMLFFYYSIGTSLERAWGDYLYNVYIFGGILITVVASFLCMGFLYLIAGDILADQTVAKNTFALSAMMYSTYYVNMSIFLAYAITFPEYQVLLMFVVPVKVKWLGWAYGVMLLFELGQSALYALTFHPVYWFNVVAIAASLLNFLIFWLRTKNLSHLSPKQVKRRVEFKHQVRQGEKQSGHKCSICGRTDADDPTLQFRFCSKCAGAHEYCQNHLFTHEHVR